MGEGSESIEGRIFLLRKPLLPFLSSHLYTSTMLSFSVYVHLHEEGEPHQELRLCDGRGDALWVVELPGATDSSQQKPPFCWVRDDIVLCPRISSGPQVDKQVVCGGEGLSVIFTVQANPESVKCIRYSVWQRELVVRLLSEQECCQTDATLNVRCEGIVLLKLVERSVVDTAAMRMSGNRSLLQGTNNDSLFSRIWAVKIL